MGVVFRNGVHHEAVHARAVHRGDVFPLGAGRDQQQPLAGVFAGEGQALEEAHGARVAEGVREVFGEQQSDRSRFAGAQRSGHRVRPGVPEPAGRLQDPLAQLRGELVRTVVGVGNRGSGNTELRRE